MSLKRVSIFLFGFFALVCCSLVLWPGTSHPCIGIISDDTYCGERELAWRIKIAAENLGWKAILDEKRGCHLKKKKGVDWVLCMNPRHERYNKHSHNYITLLHPFEYEKLKKKPNCCPFYERYNGYLLTITPKEDLKIFLQSKNKPFFSVPFYPTLQYVEYMKVPLNTVMTMISVWGNRLGDEKFKRLYSLLSQGGFTKFYGVNDHHAVAQEHYLGKLPFDGVSVIHAIQKHGISLIFHSDTHNREKIPSSRIFEAAAASAVIISDTNAFVKKHFGENVFYVDTSLSAEEIYLQIENHVNTIRLAPEKALEMAKRAHEIFVDQFLMETQLINIMSMHQEIIKYEKKRSMWFF